MALQTTNISTDLIKNALGTTTNAIWALCNDPSINKWSKYKPVLYNWPSVDGSYGLNRADWSYYARIQGSEGQFAGYEHNRLLAIPPILSIASENTIRDLNPMLGTSNFNMFVFRHYKTTSPVKISTTEMGLDNFYYGLKIVANSITYYKTYGIISGATENVQITMQPQAQLVSQWTANPAFNDLPYYIGSFTATMVLCSSSRSSWSTSVPGTVYDFPTISRDSSLTTTGGSFNVNNWVDTSILDFNWTATGVYNDLSTHIYSSWDSLPEWSIISKPDWITEAVYDDAGNNYTNPDVWQSGYKLVLRPSINTGVGRNGTVDISAGNSGTLQIYVSQDAGGDNPTVEVVPEDGQTFTITNLGGSISIGSNQLTFSFTGVLNWSSTPETMYYYIVDGTSTTVATGSLLAVRNSPYGPWGETKTINRNAIAGDNFTIRLNNGA